MLAHDSSFGTSGVWVKIQLRSKVNGDDQRGKGREQGHTVGMQLSMFSKFSYFFLIVMS